MDGVEAQHVLAIVRPAGASVAELLTQQAPQPYLVLTAWAVLSCAVFWTWRHRHPGGRRHDMG